MERKNDKRMNYRLSRIAAICGGKFSGCDSEVRSVVTDSRSLSCELGCRPMFVAMRGANHDSHDFIADMQSRGVRAFLVERGVEASSCTGECGFVQVDNAIEALQRLAAYHRAQFRGTVVGITGSNGKTVIKEWIAEELPEGMKYYRSPKSYNSQLGVPLSVLMLEGDEELAIFEAGISKPGEMERLERIIRPDAVIFTSIGDAHQENFINLEQKCDEKMILARSASKIIYHSYYEPLGGMVAARFADRIAAVRALMPDAFIGIDVIVGFPGETEEDFRTTCDFLEELKPAFLHIFPFSERPGTPAIDMPGKVQPSVATRRVAELEELCGRLHGAFCAKAVGSEDTVLFESTLRGGMMFGYTGSYRRVKAPYDRTRINAICRVRFGAMDESHDLMGDILD